MDPSVLFILIAIVVLSLVLAGIGAYVVIHNSDEKEKAPAVIDVSGQYAVLVRPARESLERVKPRPEEIKNWLSTQNISPEDQTKLLENWNRSLEDSIRVVDEGDKNG